MAQVGRDLELSFGRYRPKGASGADWNSFSNTLKMPPFDLVPNDLTWNSFYALKVDISRFLKSGFVAS